MNYTLISAKEFNAKLKCTIHSSGKLGFTEAAANHMRITNQSYIQFAQDNDEKDILYLIHHKSENADSFKAIKAGTYFYLNTKAMFDSLGLDYKKHTIIFDMTDLKEDSVEIYKLIKRQKPRKNKKE